MIVQDACEESHSHLLSNRILDSFECVEAFITDQDAFDNAMVTMNNSNMSFSNIDYSFNEEYVD